MTTETAQVRRVTEWKYPELRDLADNHGTPLYVIDLDRIRANYRRFHAAFPESEIFYAAKANTSHAVLAALREESVGIECASAGEIDRSRRAGFSPDRINYTAVNPPDADLDYAVAIPGLTITAGAIDTVDRLDERGFDGRLSIRVNPGIGVGHHDHVTTGTNPKFGISHHRASDILTTIADRGFDLAGIHAHAGSGITNDDLSTYRDFLDRLCGIASDLPFDLEFVDIGGGFGVPYHPEEAPLDLNEIATEVQDAMQALAVSVVIEPGRYLVADAGVLLTRVNTVKDTPDDTVIGVDAGMNTLIRPALYDAYHHIVNLEADAPDRERQPVTVTGPICESADIFGEHRSLPVPDRDDLLGIGTAGAYGYEMASQYNSRPRPAIVAIDDAQHVVVRERETFRDLTRGERQ